MLNVFGGKAQNPERNGMEPEVIVAQYGHGHRIWTPDMLWKIGVNMPGLSMYGELILHPVPATKTGQAPSRQHRATPSL